MIPQEKTVTHRIKALLPLTLLALVAGGTFWYSLAWGQERGAQGPASVQIPGSTGTIPSLTDEERSWLREHPVIRIAQDPRWPPVEFADEQGEPSGISNDYVKLFEQRLGIKFERVRGLTWQESYARLKRWDIDMTTCVAVTQERMQFWAFTEPYLKIPIVILTHADVTYIGNMRELDGKRVGVVEGYVASEWIQRDFPDIQLVRVNSVKEGLDLLQKGQIFAFVDNMLVIGYYLAQLKLTNLKIAGATPYINAQCMAVRKDWAILARIMQKALDSISETERAQIYQKWVPIRYEHGFDYKLLWQALAIFAVVLAALLVWNRKLSREIKSREQAEAALRESEQRMRAITNSTQDAIIVINDRGEISFWNPSAERIFGHKAPEAKGKDAHALLAPQDYHQNNYAAMGQFSQTGKGALIDRTVELEAVRRNGEKFPIELSLSSFQMGDSWHAVGIVRDISDRHQAQEALRLSEAKFSAAFHATPDALSIVRLEDGLIIEINDKWEAMFGFTREEAIGKSVIELGLYVNPVDRQALITRLSEEGSVRDGELTVRRKTGDIRLVLLSAQLIEVEGEQCMLSIVRDVTESKRAENGLKESEERFRSVFRTSPDAINLNRLADGVYVDANDGFTDLTGFTRDDIIGRSSADIHIWADLRDRERLVEELTKHGKVNNLETKFRLKDGTTRTGLMSARVMSIDGIPHIVSITRDIEEMKQTEEERTRLAEAVEQVAETVIITDDKGTILYVNPAFERTTGYTQEEAQRNNPRMLKSGEHDKEFYRHMWSTISSGQVWHGHLITKRKDGTILEEEATISPIRDHSGRIVNYVAVMRDVTKEIYLQKQLFQAQKMEAIGTLAGGVAHDFNNILQVVLGFTELILGDEELPRQYRSDLQKVSDSAKRGADLVQRLLTLSRKAEIKPQPLNLNHRITELQKMLERTLPKMIEIQLSLDGKLAAINADHTQIDQVLMNLAVNARDAMPDGGTLTFATANVTLDEEYAKAHLEATPGNYVLLTVTDTGAGMDKHTLEHIFEPFYTTKAVGEGTGLGLAMVHGIAKQHEGHIGCYSEPGHGSTFKIYFPALVGEEELKETSATVMPRGGSETILLVDDEDLIRDLGIRILTKAGYTVIEASDGEAALGIYQRRRDEISLILLDLIMPKMGGSQCLEALLRLNPAIKVVIASGYVPDAVTKAKGASAAKGFVSKPYNIRQVLEVVRHVLDSE